MAAHLRAHEKSLSKGRNGGITCYVPECFNRELKGLKLGGDKRQTSELGKEGDVVPAKIQT